MEPQHWWYLAGVLLILILLFFFGYLLSQTNYVIRNGNGNGNTNSWVDNYLRVHPSDCLKYLPIFEGEYWNAAPVSQFNNCYAYAFRNLDLNRTHKPQPGELSHIPEVPKEDYSCEKIFSNVIKDHPGTFQWDPKTPCPCGYFKGFLVLSKNPPDYHFVREDSNGYWSHKLGSGAATQYDASGRLIQDPFRANLNYGQYNYNLPCFTFCIPYAKTETPW